MGYHVIMKPNIKKKVMRRLTIIEGQIRGLQRMVVEGQYCVKIIHQSSAARRALAGIEDLMLQNHLRTHVVEQMKTGKGERAVDEIMDIYKLSKRR